MENTITEQDMDATSRRFVHGFRQEPDGFEPDLSVDGLSESLVSRLFRLLGLRHSA